MVLARLQFVEAALGEERGPQGPVATVDGGGVVGVELDQGLPGVEVELHASITFRQYSYMPRIRVSVTM